MNEQETEKKSIGGDLIIPVAGILFTLYYFSTILDSPWEAQVNALFVGSTLIGLSLLFMIKTIVDVRSGNSELSFAKVLAPKSFRLKRVLLLLLMVGYAIVIEWGGFTITTFAFLYLGMFLLNDGRRKGLILWLSALLALVGYLLFIVAFETRFPFGPFENLMKGVL